MDGHIEARAPSGTAYPAVQATPDSSQLEAPPPSTGSGSGQGSGPNAPIPVVLTLPTIVKLIVGILGGIAILMGGWFSFYHRACQHMDSHVIHLGEREREKIQTKQVAQEQHKEITKVLKEHCNLHSAKQNEQLANLQGRIELTDQKVSTILREVRRARRRHTAN